MAISGKFLTASYGAGPTTIAGTHEWSVQEQGDALEATTGANNGRGSKEVGVIDTRIRIRFYFDNTTGVMAFIRTGTDLSNLRLFARSGATNAIYVIGTARVMNTNLVGQVRDRLIVDVDLEAVGDVITFTNAN